MTVGLSRRGIFAIIPYTFNIEYPYDERKTIVSKMILQVKGVYRTVSCSGGTRVRAPALLSYFHDSEFYRELIELREISISSLFMMSVR